MVRALRSAGDGRIGKLWGRVVGEGLQPPAEVVAERLNRNTRVSGRVAIEAMQRAAEQGCGATGVAALQMVKGRCNLDKRLEKRLFRLRRLQPDALPVLVRHKKFLVAITAQAFGQWTVVPIEGHRFIIEHCAGDRCV